MCIAAIFPTYHNAARTVLIDIARSIMQLRTGHVTGREAQVEVS